MRSAFLVANIAVIPFRPSQADLDTLPNISEIINAALDLNPKLICKALLTMAPTNPVINETEEASVFLKEYPVMDLLKPVVRDRKVYRDALSEGCGVIEMGNAKAKQEINQLMREVLK